MGVEIDSERKHKSKKRKQESNGYADGSGEVKEDKRSREERKEAKRLKKLRKLEKKEKSLSVDQDGAPRDLSREESVEKPDLAAASAHNGHTGGPDDGSQRLSTDLSKSERKRKRGSEMVENVKTPAKAYQQATALSALPSTETDKFYKDHGISISNGEPLDSYRPITQFSYLPTSVLKDRSILSKFATPTPIQAASWPFLLSGRDVVGVAETGSGKTLAFGVPLVQSIAHKNQKQKRVRAAIVSPTRELAMQIHGQMGELATSAGLEAVCVYGGVSKDEQRQALKTASIVTATPGRLNDLVEEGSADLSHVQYLVLDEADRMLDKGFEDEIRKIIDACASTGRQTLMFTATWPRSVRELASTYMSNAVNISIGRDNPTGELRANRSITQIVEVIDPYEKQNRLVQLLEKHQGSNKKNTPPKRILIFTLYKKEAARIDSFLRSRRFHVAAIHGDMSQATRTASLDGFRTGTCPLLVATDVAARGLDIPEVELVINLTFPLTAEDYVHRIGRTGRAGKTGLAITLFTEHDKPLAGALVNVLKAADQPVPEALLKFGTTVKKKGHEAYGAFYRDLGDGEKKAATKIKF